MKIAILGTENSHALAFARLIKEKAKYRDVEITGVYGYDAAANQKLLDEGLVSYAAQDPHEFLGKVDGIVVVARHGDHHHEYALPYVKAGIPAFIDKPFTVDLEKAQELLDAAKENGALICGGSSLKFADEFLPLKRYAEKNTVVGGYVAAPINMVNDYAGFYFYSQHLIEILFTVFGKDIKTVYASCPDESKNRVSVIVGYDTFDVTIQFVDCYHYAAGVVCKEGVQTAVASDIVYCYEKELDEYFHMVKEQKMEQDYAEYKKPVTLLHCIQESYQQKKVVEVKW
ncbi:MAG: Gfo/Idh/MocA family oxidoreductase [Clostridiales bacterium]|nr:Gfo/Idh/MocA family oxidoreductase [Clostridiales bacterium]